MCKKGFEEAMRLSVAVTSRDFPVSGRNNYSGTGPGPGRPGRGGCITSNYVLLHVLRPIAQLPEGRLHSLAVGRRGAAASSLYSASQCSGRRHPVDAFAGFGVGVLVVGRPDQEARADATPPAGWLASGVTGRSVPTAGPGRA
jgi:hypothetical protein